MTERSVSTAHTAHNPCMRGRLVLELGSWSKVKLGARILCKNKRDKSFVLHLVFF